MKTRSQFYLLGLICILVLCMVVVIGGMILASRSYTSSSSAKIQGTQQAKVLTISINIQTRSGTAISFPHLSVQDGSTALTATKQATEVQSSGDGTNAFVTGLDGLSADAGKRQFWELIINGKSASIGAGSYFVQDGDSIVWKISTY